MNWNCNSCDKSIHNTSLQFVRCNHLFECSLEIMKFYDSKDFSRYFIPFQPGVAFHIEISHLICNANDFYMECNTELKMVKLVFKSSKRQMSHFFNLVKV